MRIEDLKIFVDVVRYHSMNIAAENNFTTPQNLSKIIKRMEDELGVVLFNRSKRGSELTEEGEKFYLQIVEILNQYNDAVACLKKVEHYTKNINDEFYRDMKVMCTQGVLSYAVMDAYNSMENYGYNFSLEEDEINFYDVNKIVEYQKNKEFDMIACIVNREDVDNFTENLNNKYIPMHVFFDEMVLVVSENHPISKRSIISIRELKEWKVVSFKDNIVYGNMLDLNFSHQIITNSFSKALELIRESDSYCTILCKSFINFERKKFGPTSNFRMVRLKEKIDCAFVILLNKKHVNDEIMMEFTKRISENFFDSEKIMNSF